MMPTSALEWVLTLSLMPLYLWYGWTTGFRIGYFVMLKLLGEDEAQYLPHDWLPPPLLDERILIWNPRANTE